jgi:hypothetical protein
VQLGRVSEAELLAGANEPFSFNRWQPDDDDFVESAQADLAFAEELQHLLSRVDLLEELLRLPRLTRFVSRTWPEMLATNLLATAQDTLAPKGRSFDVSPIGRWQIVTKGMECPSALAQARALADGYHQGLRRLSVLGGAHARQVEGIEPNDNSSDYVSDLVVLRGLAYHQRLEAAGVRASLRKRVMSDPAGWMALLPWLLHAMPEQSLLIEQTFLAVSAGCDPRDALTSAMASGLEVLALRASGLAEVLGGVTETSVELMARIAQSLDDGRRAFPRPLGEPASTWLADLNLESEFRSVIDSTLDSFAAEFLTQGGAEEEGHVGSLLTRLEERLRAAEVARGLTTDLPRPVEFRGSYRRIPKTEEAMVNADLALVVSIDAHALLKLDLADFVQVKKSTRGPVPLDSDRWTIKLDQLDGLLSVSDSAVYWLITGSGSILVVPAKLLLAVAQGTGVADQGTFTLYYPQVRHAAIALSSYLVDLLSGTWLGIQAAEALALARGESSSTKTRAVFELSVRYSPG